MTTVRRRTRSSEYSDDHGIISDIKQTTEERKSNLSCLVDTMSISCRDRTSEFVSAVRSLQSRQVSLCYWLVTPCYHYEPVNFMCVFLGESFSKWSRQPEEAKWSRKNTV